MAQHLTSSGPPPGLSWIKSSLSFSNGNCVEFAYHDGVFYLRDGKLGTGSPVWALTPEELGRIAQQLTRCIGWIPDVLMVSLGGSVFTMTRIARTRDGDEYIYRWDLSRQPGDQLYFDSDEVTSFLTAFWGGQIREDGPPRPPSLSGRIWTSSSR